MISKEWFREWFDSPFYHKLYFERNQEDANRFVTRLLECIKPAENSRLLDIACGRGRHSIYMAAKGYDITGIDLSQNNIQFAKKFENDHLHFFQHDMRLPLMVNYFDAAFNFFTSFGYFHTTHEHRGAIRSVAASLKKGGKFVLDYLNAEWVEKNLVPDEIKTVGDTKFNIRRWQDERDFYKEIIIEDPTLHTPITFTERVAKLKLNNFQSLFSGLLVIDELYGNYEFQPYLAENSPRLILIAHK